VKSICQWGSLLSSNREIIQLPVDVSNKIAAGEVIDRPCNVIKELLENAVDAGAENITVEITDGGISLIKVTDDGRGILPEDLPVTVSRFATSKINSIDDIYCLNTFGFRGEALAAVSSVSDFCIKSKRKGYDCFSLSVYFGNTGEIKPAAGLDGTVVTVKNLFENIPARRKFLKTPAAEQREIVKFIKQFSLVNYHICLKLIVNDKKTLVFSKDDGMLSRAKKVFNEENLLYLNNKYDDLNIEAVISTPEIQKLRKDNLVVGVNGRVIRDNMLVQCIVKAYKRLLPEGKYPVGCVVLYLDSSDLDVNVHPAKLFVKFLNSGEIFSFVYDSISSKLGELTAAPEYDNSGYESLINNQEISYNHIVQKNKELYDKPGYSHDKLNSSSVYDLLNSQTYSAFEVESDSVYDDEYDFRVVGQLFNTVIICEFEDFYYLIDQHIAHERILYEKYKSESFETEISSINLTEPITINLNKDECELLFSNKDILVEFGYDIEDFGGTSVKVNRIPSEIINKDIKQEIADILQEIEFLTKRGVKDSTLVVMSCKSAIKAGERLSAYEMKHLVLELLKTKNPFTCPHGRPIIFKQAKEELFRKFHR